MNIEEEKLIYLNTKYDEEQLKYIYQNNQIILNIVDRIKIVNHENHNNYSMIKNK